MGPVYGIAISYEEMSVVYSELQISNLLKLVREEGQSRIPTFLDFDRKNVVLKLLRMKIW